MSLHGAAGVRGGAGVDAGILELSVVYDQLGDVGNHDVSEHVIGSHHCALFTLHLLFPSDRRFGFTRHLAQEAGRFAHEHEVVHRIAHHHRRLNVHRGGLQMSRGGPHGGLLRERAGVGEAKVELAGDFGESDPPRARLRVQVAFVVVGHAVRGAGEAGLPSAAVFALAHRLPVPDVAFGTLLVAQELVAGDPFGHAHRTFPTPEVHVAGGHAALVSTNVGTALLEWLAVLGKQKKRLERVLTFVEVISLYDSS